MSDSSVWPGHGDGLLDGVGALVLLAGAVALGGMIAIGVTVVTMRRRKAHQIRSESGIHPDAERGTAPVVADGTATPFEGLGVEDRRAR